MVLIFKLFNWSKNVVNKIKYDVLIIIETKAKTESLIFCPINNEKQLYPYSLGISKYHENLVKSL